MTWTARILLTILTIARALAGGDAEPVPATGDGVAIAEAPELTAGQASLVAEGFALFTGAGLEAPTDVVTSFHDTTEACNGNLGLSTIEDGVSRLRICWTHEDAAIEARLQQQVIVHELAHAWADRNVDDALRSAFVEFTGADSWNLAASEWAERGTEQAADLITWALLDPAVLFVDFAGTPCHTWPAAFELLTGVEAPAPLAEAC